jgi:hypothetical protein
MTYNRSHETDAASDARLNQDQRKGGRVDGSRRTTPVDKKPGIDSNKSKEDGNNDGLNCQDLCIQCAYPGISDFIYAEHLPRY